MGPALSLLVISIVVIVILAFLLWLLEEPGAVAGLLLILSVIVLVVGGIAIMIAPNIFNVHSVHATLSVAGIVFTISIFIALFSSVDY